MLGFFHFHCFSERCNEILEIVCFCLSLEGGNLDMKAGTAVLLCRLTFSECFCSLALQGTNFVFMFHGLMEQFYY